MKCEDVVVKVTAEQDERRAVLARIKARLDAAVDPKASIFRGVDQPLYKQALRIFGSWAAALAQLGVDYRQVTGRWPRGALEDPEVRREATRCLARKLGRCPTRRDFESEGLAGMLEGYYGGSGRSAMLDAGLDLPPAPRRVPTSAWADATHRLERTRSIPKMVGKAAAELKAADFRAHAPGLLAYLSPIAIARGTSTVFVALEEAGLVGSAGELAVAPNGTWADAEVRRNAIRDAVVSSGKDVRQIEKDDLVAAGLGGMLQVHYGNSRTRALIDAGLITWAGELARRPPDFWTHQANRSEAVRRVLERSKKKPEDITFDDFRRAGFGGLLGYYQRRGRTAVSPLCAALRDAGYSSVPEDVFHTPFGRGRVHTAVCGHRVRSLFESEVHRLVVLYGVPDHDHQRQYPGAHRLTCDVVIPPARKGAREIWIEAAGMLGCDGEEASGKYEARLKRKRAIARHEGFDFIVIEPEDLRSSSRLIAKLQPLEQYRSLSPAARDTIKKTVRRWQIMFERRRDGFWSKERVIELLRNRDAAGKPMNSRAVEVEDSVLYQYTRIYFGQYGHAFEAATGRPYSTVAKRRRGTFFVAVRAAEAAKGIKTCGQCKKEKSVDSFSRHARSADGRFYRCRECDKSYATRRRRR